MLPPKIGDGVEGSKVGVVNGADLADALAGAFFAPSSALTTTLALRGASRMLNRCTERRPATALKCVRLDAIMIKKAKVWSPLAECFSERTHAKSILWNLQHVGDLMTVINVIKN